MFRTLATCIVMGSALLVLWLTLKASMQPPEPPKPAPVYYLTPIPSVPSTLQVRR